MDIVLIAGLWLDASAWDEVVAALKEQGHRGIPVALPGQGDGDDAATLEDQVAAVLAVVDACDAPPLVVGHSAAASLAWIAADRRAGGGVAGATFVGGFPESDGAEYAAFFPCVDGAMPFPGWGPFEGADSADLDDEAKARIAAAAIPVPEAVATGIVRLTDPARQSVPVTVVCPEFTPEEAMGWIDAGDVPELAEVERLRLVDLDSGHWPMFTRPVELAALLDDVVTDLTEGVDDLGDDEGDE